MGKLSVMVGMRPTGLQEFVAVAKPNGIYSLNNNLGDVSYPWIFRIQNEVWGRLPDACGIERYFETEDPERSAIFELTQKTQYVPRVGHLNLLELWKRTSASWFAPYNEWVLGNGPDSVLKTEWFERWNIKALQLAFEQGLHLCIGSFATGEPDLELVPLMYLMFRSAKACGAVIDIHEYGIEGPLMSSPSSGALLYRRLYASLPEDCRIPFIMSEFWWGNGFEQESVNAQIADAVAYGYELERDDYVLWASAFQLDMGAESSFSQDALMAYATAIANMNPPGPKPEPEPESEQFPFAVITHLLPTDAKAEEVEIVAEEARVAHQSTCFNRVLARHDVLAGAPGSKVFVWAPERFQGNVTEDLTPAPFTVRHFPQEPPPPPSPPSSIVWRGLQMSADGNSSAINFDALTIAGCDAAKIMTNTGFGELDTLIHIGLDPRKILLRLFAAGDNPSLKNPARFVEEQSAWLAYFASKGGVCIEIHNEPNLTSEGLGFAWKDAQEFGVWFRNVSAIIRSKWPRLLAGWPGLSPQPNVSTWLPVLDTCIASNLVDWVGAHSYWVDSQTMDSEEHGRYYRRFLNRGRNVIITEFNNCATSDGDEAKGEQYKRYYGTLESGVIAAYAFVSSATWKEFNDLRMTWVRKGSITRIPYVVGS